MLNSILIANRGEIAVRIIRACRHLGLHSIAVYSEADSNAPHVRLADESHCIGPAPVRESYLDMEKLISTARRTGADAIHPGYGMLSENAEFARRVNEAGLTFVGPNADVISLMGDKTAARAQALRIGLPVLPGSDGPLRNADEAQAIAKAIGYPVVVKASFGGGGRGMRVARAPEELSRALDDAARESGLAFGRSEVFIERYIDGPRHVEVQILADSHGNVVHLGDRDCSVQRRHQKLLEEAPAPNLPQAVRTRMAAAAVDLVSRINYCGAGTVEFLYDPAVEAFYFLEMNTRLQVEHGVTELVTGIDIVTEQLIVASGEKLSFSQNDVTIRGHAIQARIAAEDPWQDFRPTPGHIKRLTLPLGPWLRLDFGVESDGDVPQHYDSMFGKIHAVGTDRDQALHRLDVALGELRVEGISTTAPYLRSVLRQDAFRAARHDTGSLGRDWLPAPEDRPSAATSDEAEESYSGAEEMTVHERWVTVSTTDGPIEIAIPQRRHGSRKLATGKSGPTRGRGVPGQQDASASKPVAPMDSTVTRVDVTPGQPVSKGTILVVLEAMKMEMPIVAAQDLTVADVLVGVGQAVKRGTLLVAVA